MSVEYVNVVICKHPNCEQHFLFRAPENAEHGLNAGDRVLVTTSRGPGQMAQCITPQFTIADFQLKEFYNTTIDKLKPVTAYLKPLVFAYVPPKE
jgi:hypothetical protein